MRRKKKLVKHARNTRVPCICIVRTAKMMFKGHCIGLVSEERNDAGEFDWVIRPNWEVLDSIEPIQISGIDMDLRLEEYIRTYVPVFIEQRTLPDTRDGLYEELERVGLNYNDRFEFMCRTHGLCGNNDITIDRLTEEEQIEFDKKYPIESLKP